MTTTPPRPPTTPTDTARPGAPFGLMLRGALAPSAVVGVLTVVVLVVVRGGSALAGASLGLVVALAFYASGMFLLSRLVTSANPFAFFAVAMAVYLAQVIALLLFMMAFVDADWVDGKALGIVAGVVTIVWQVFAFRALRTARIPVYDEPGLTSTDRA